MVIIVRRSEVFSGVMHKGTRVYCPPQPITNAQKEEAERLDKRVGELMSEIASDAKRLGLLQLKGKNGVLRLWHFVGERLSFVDNVTIVCATDRQDDRYIWEALWYHAGPLVPGKADRKDAGTARDHWRMCYRLAKFGVSEYLESVGTWRDWVEFLESPVVNADPRILGWVSSKMADARVRRAKNRLLRELTVELRNRFKNRETGGILTDEELQEELEECWAIASQ